MTIRALLFDLWGTLIHEDNLDGPERWRRAIYRNVQAVLARNGLHYPFDRFEAALNAFASQQREMHAAGQDISQPERMLRILEHFEDGLAGRLGASVLVDVEAAFNAGNEVDPPFAAPGALAALRDARARDLNIGLVSITGLTPGYVLRPLLDKLDMLQHLGVMTFSDEARLAKPAPAVYHCTLEVLGVEASDAVFIGDSPIPDIHAPQQLGMTAVQVGEREEDGVTPDARIDSLEDLFPALRRLGLVD